jgi:hypothetical protein
LAQQAGGLDMRGGYATIERRRCFVPSVGGFGLDLLDGDVHYCFDGPVVQSMLLLVRDAAVDHSVSERTAGS